MQLTEDVIKAQQAAYSVAGVDEEVRPPFACACIAETETDPASLIAQASAEVPKEERKNKKKRKGGAQDGDGADGKPAKKPRGNTAVFVSNLPASTTVDQLSETFSKAGLILEDVSGEPKIKMYRDENGRFKGEALVVYLQEASVELACRLLDETELVLGSGDGVMSVKVAEWDNSKKAAGNDKKEGAAGGGGKGKGAEANGETDEQAHREKARQGKRAAALRQCVLSRSLTTVHTLTSAFCTRKLEDWSSDEDEAANAAVSRKFRGVIVLEGMFSLKELDEDPALLLDLKEDVRDECATLGEVTNVTLYDVRSTIDTLAAARPKNESLTRAAGRQKEEKGIMTVRFKDELAAQACMAVRSSSLSMPVLDSRCH